MPKGVCGIAEDALGGVGGEAGRKNDGMAATLDCVCQLGRQVWGLTGHTMMDMYRTMFGISEGLVAHSESTSWPIAAPSGFARLATAVALVRPRSENQRSL